MLLIVSFQVNELIDCKNAVQGLGVVNIEYENIEINIHCIFESNNENFQMNMVIFPPRANPCLNFINF